MPTHQFKNKKLYKKLNADLNQTTKWHFSSCDGDDAIGINDPLLENFDSHHAKNITRESIQNSVDARLDDTRPVTVVFELIRDLPTNELPGAADLKQKIGYSKTYNNQTKSFLDQASRYLNQKTIHCLRISDFNTEGLTGAEDDRRGSYYKLVKAIGVNAKAGVGGGSFGLGGKAAQQKSSLIRTVFYSSYNHQEQFLLAGKARLPSFKDADGDLKRGSGMYGLVIKDKKGVSAIRHTKSIPVFFRNRSEQNYGTDVYIFGYLGYSRWGQQTDWRQAIINQTINNFWPAIHFGQLIVKLKDQNSQTTIDQDRLEELIDDQPNKQDIKPYHQAVIAPSRQFIARDNPQLITKHRDILGKGKIDASQVKLYVKTKAGYPSKTQKMRRPKMVIRARPKRARRIGPDYAAVLICQDPYLDDFLRDLEPPEHDDWLIDRAQPNNQFAKSLAEARQVIRFLKQFTRQSLDELVATDQTQSQELADLGKYLPVASQNPVPAAGQVADSITSDNTSTTNNPSYIHFWSTHIMGSDYGIIVKFQPPNKKTIATKSGQINVQLRGEELKYPCQIELLSNNPDCWLADNRTIKIKDLKPNQQRVLNIRLKDYRKCLIKLTWVEATD